MRCAGAPKPNHTAADGRDSGNAGVVATHAGAWWFRHLPLSVER
jgi:hypothetical protein